MTEVVFSMFLCSFTDFFAFSYFDYRPLPRKNCQIQIYIYIGNNDIHDLHPGVDMLTEEEDGWETVQRGGKSRTKPPVARKSCDNKSDNIKSQKNKNSKQMSGKADSNHTELSKDKQEVQQPDLSCNSHSSLKRTSSKDSEKENRPLEIFEDRTNNNEQHSSGQSINIMNNVANKVPNSVITSDPVPNEGSQKTDHMDGQEKCSDRDLQQGITSPAAPCPNGCAENSVAEDYKDLINQDYEKEDEDDMDDRLTQHAQHLDKVRHYHNCKITRLPDADEVERFCKKWLYMYMIEKFSYLAKLVILL